MFLNYKKLIRVVNVVREEFVENFFLFLIIVGHTWIISIIFFTCKISTGIKQMPIVNIFNF